MASKLVTVMTASSNSGAQCVKDLLSRGRVGVRAVFRSEKKADSFLQHTKHSDVELVVGPDAREPSSLREVFESTNVAVIVTPHDVSQGMKDDADLSNNMISAAVDANVDHIIYVGSWTVKDEERIGLIAKRFVPTEKKLQTLTGTTFTSLRGGVFNNNWFLLGGRENIVKSNTLTLPDSMRMASVDPRDIGSMAAIIAEDVSNHTNKFYEVTGPQILSPVQVSMMLTETLGVPIKHQHVDVDEFCSQLPPFLSGLWATVCREPNYVPFSSDVEQVTGTPARNLTSWVADNKALFMGQ